MKDPNHLKDIWASKALASLKFGKKDTLYLKKES